jgi:hypothetical protein
LKKQCVNKNVAENAEKNGTTDGTAAKLPDMAKLPDVTPTAGKFGGSWQKNGKSRRYSAHAGSRRTPFNRL